MSISDQITRLQNAKASIKTSIENKGVTVPNSGGLKGIDVAAVLGIVGGDANKNLEVLSSIKEEDIAKTKELISNNFCQCDLIEGSENLHIIIEAKYKDTQRPVYFSGLKENVTSLKDAAKSPCSYAYFEKNGIKILFFGATQILNTPSCNQMINFFPGTEEGRQNLITTIKNLKSKLQLL